VSVGEQGWSSELKFLLERHPRSTWPARHSSLVEFWLGVHERLRRDCASLSAVADDYRSGRFSATELAVVAAPRLRGLIAAMHGHHQIEDFQYFPAFRRAEGRLARGFDRLEAEHADLRNDVDSALAALAELRMTIGSEANAALAARRYVERSQRLCQRLVHHLEDEEDLVVPVLLEHGGV
jgi:hypothetical protein